ncbi:MAG: DUF1129 domain-containing protein [Oscillospiraceae bacterium]|nr:DUF1129 domain-containing protein [Oscillospiraceae bacterium]
MGLFIHDEPLYDGGRLTGFSRYKELLSIRFGQWWKINLLTLLGFTPLAAGIFYAIATSSILVLCPCSLVGGMIAGPFLAGMYDAVLRGMRDEHRPWWDCYQLAWKQNWKGGALLGAVMGLLLGMYAFMGMMLFWWAEVRPGLWTVALYLLGMLLILAVNSLLWPQIVLFRQKATVRLYNAGLFFLLHFWRALGVGALQLGYWAVFVLFAPWTLLLLPVTGIWYIVFLSQFLLYEQMDNAFHIEEQFDMEDEHHFTDMDRATN